MQHKEIIHAEDGFELKATRFTPDSETAILKVMLIASATGVKQAYYADIATYFSQHGWLVYTFDYRGIGESRPASLKQFHAFMHQWGTLDLAAMVDAIQRQYAQAKLFYVGHSIGGQIIGLTEKTKVFEKIVIVASSIGYWRHWPLSLRYKMVLYWYFLIPAITYLWGYFPAKKLGLFEDLPKAAALEWCKWNRSPKALFASHPEIEQNLTGLKTPLIAVSFEDDTYYAPRPAIDWLLSQYSRHFSLSHYHLFPKDFSVASIGHFGFFRKKFEATLWPLLTQWLQKPESI